MLNGLNISFPIYYDDNGTQTPFHDLVLRKAVVNSVVMSLSDKITGDVVYNGSDLEFTMKEYVVHNGVKYYLVNPPTVLREGLVKDNSDLKGATRYSFEFYHPMYMLSNFPFTDVAVSFDEQRYKSHDKTFSWIGYPQDYVNKLNKNLEGTEWVIILSDRFSQAKAETLSEVMPFDNATIADALKTGYETWDVPYVVDKLDSGQYSYTNAQYPNGRDYYADGKRFVVLFGLPSTEIYENATQALAGTTPFVFRFGQGVGLKNNSRTPRNNKIITRIAGYGSENNIPYGYPQIRWYGDPDATCTIGDSVGAKSNYTAPNGEIYTYAMSYPIYDGIVGGEYVKLIKHPFTRSHLMPSVYSQSVFNKVSQYTTDEHGDVIANPDYDPNIEIVDYYDAISETGYEYFNEINPSAPSYEMHGFEDIKPELGEAKILGAAPVNADLTPADGWDDTMDDNGNYLQSYFSITLPQLTFDIYACAAITQEMQINMRSGACLGCTFTVQVDWEDYKRNFYDSDGNFAPNGTQRDLTRYPKSNEGIITIIVQKENSTFGVLMPNIYQYPHGESSVGAADGDQFVVLGISLPLSYITNAEGRLDDEMKSYMLENNVHYFDYPLKFDEFFLANKTYILNQLRPNSIVRFEYNDEQLELFVKQLTIKYNESVLPQYDITLTDNIEVVLNQIGQVADDVEHLGALVAMLRQGYSASAGAEIAKKLSKIYDDAAAGHITFTKGATFSDEGFLSGFFGHGARIDNKGNGEFESINVRGAMTAAELVFNLVSAQGGEAFYSAGQGTILDVWDDNGTPYASLKLEGDEWATINEGDICRGTFNTVDTEITQNEDGVDNTVFRKRKGFFVSYFQVVNITKNVAGECIFEYSLRPNTTLHPCSLMKFAQYGNFDYNNRQSVLYLSALGETPRMLHLAGVDTWEIKPENIKIAIGYINGLTVWQEVDATEYGEFSGTVGVDKKTWTTTDDGVETTHYAVLKPLVGNSGFYCENNIYLGGIIEQFKAAAMEAITSGIANVGQARVMCNYDSFPVDCDEFGDILDDVDLPLEATLWYGNTQLTITSATASWNDTSIGSVSSNTWSATINFFQGVSLMSGVVNIALTGTDTNNNEYTATKTVAVIANRQGETGGTGNSAAIVETDKEYFIINCDSSGHTDGDQQIVLTSQLKVDNYYAVLSPTHCSYTLDSTTLSDLIYQPLGNSPTQVTNRSVTISNGSVPNKKLVVSLRGTRNGVTYTAKKTIHIIPNKQGETGAGKAGYSAQLTKASDNIVIDSLGNVVGVSVLANRLFTDVSIYDATLGATLVYQDGSDTLQSGKFRATVSTQTNCEASVDGSNGRITISSIDKTKDWCSVGITATTYDGVIFNFVYTVTFTHLDQSYLTFDLTNEYDSIAYRTQTNKYDGLPIETWIKSYAYNESGNEEIGTIPSGSSSPINFIKSVTVSSNNDLLDSPIIVSTRQKQDGTYNGYSTTSQIVVRDDVEVGLNVSVTSNGRIRVTRFGDADIDMPDSKHYLDISCVVLYGGVEYTSPTKRFTLVETTDSTIYRLILSATAISQEETTYTPSTIDVKASVTDDRGTKIYTVDSDELVDEDWEELANPNIKIRYVDGTTLPTTVNDSLLATCPSFNTLNNKAFSVVLVDISDENNPDYLDIQTVTINAGGKDGAGQSWVDASHDQFIVDCNEQGYPLSNRTATIDATLRWGDEKCYIAGSAVAPSSDPYTYSTSSGNQPTAENLGWASNAEIHYRVRKNFKFVTTKSYNSGLVRISLSGTLNGETHTATKTVSIIMNRKGSNGISLTSVVTRYLITDLFEGVTSSTETQNWVDEYVEPTEEKKYLWRYTLYTYSNGNTTETPCELIRVWQDTANPNLLADTEFVSGHLDAWNSMGEVQGDEVVSTAINQNDYNGHNSFQVNTEESFGDPVIMLSQVVYGGGVQRIQPNTWYTLSFYYIATTSNLDNQHIIDIKLPAIDTTSGVLMYVNGGVRQSANPVSVGETQGWDRCIITFKTSSSISNFHNCLWESVTEDGRDSSVKICMPKLEVGKAATPYVSMKAVTDPIARTSTWVAGEQYYQGTTGEPYTDIVTYENRWYRCLYSHVSTISKAPQSGTTTTYWQPANNFDFIATDLLLADQAVIDLMFSQKILMRNSQNQLTASINDDGLGSYCIYYPQSGNKMMEFGADGFIHYYNDDSTNSPAWNLGHGGDISLSRSDDWKPTLLFKLSNSTPLFTSETTFDLDTYYRFISGTGGNFSQYDDAVFTTHTNNNPTEQTAASAGYYTPNKKPWYKINTDGDEDVMIYGITIYRITKSNGIAKISQTIERTFDGTQYNNETIS